MIRVRHISSDQLIKMVGQDLGNDLWVNGMFNEIRRYPNEIPCHEREIPSLLIPSCSGPEKVEWGFTAGMSCLLPGENGSIIVRRAGHFPACACLAILSLLHEADVLRNSSPLTVRLFVPEGEETNEFRRYLSESERAMIRHVRFIIKPGEPEETVKAEERKVTLPLAGRAAAQDLQQVDVGRLAVLVTGIEGNFSAGDDVTVIDGETLQVIQSHCPILQVFDQAGLKQLTSSDNANGSPVWLMFAMWVPKGTVLPHMTIVKETTPAPFIPEEMPDRPSLKPSENQSRDNARDEQNAKKGFFKRLFSRD